MVGFRASLKGMVAFLLFLALLPACAQKEVRTAHDAARYYRNYNLADLPPFDIPVEINDRVIAWMEYFQGPGRSHFERYLSRSTRYVPLMTKILREQGLPRDLIYIALIESGFSTSAYSRAAAVGPWQFIGSTGRRYGMRIDDWLDERRDPYRSTVAAASYFRDLYNEFGDWYLAMAGYNAGEGRVRNAIESTGSRNFWEMTNDGRAFRAETRDYVPKFIAAAILAKAPERFGFKGIDYQPPLEFENATVETQTDLAVVAKCAGVDQQAIVDLNPYLVRGATPPSEYDYVIRLPKGTAVAFAKQYALLPKEERIQVVRYEVRRHDTIGKIARRFGISAGQLAEANDLPISSRLRPGRTLTIPVSSTGVRLASLDQGDRGTAERSRTIRYRVRKGDTLQRIADRNGVTVAQLKRWNDLGRHAGLHRGQVLKIMKGGAPEGVPQVALQEASAERGPPAKVHVVRKRETLFTIARHYGVSTKQLLSWNDLANAKAVRVGMKLKVSAPARVALKGPTTAVPLEASAETEAVGAAPAEGLGSAPQASAERAAVAMSTADIIPMSRANVAPEVKVASKTYVVKKGETLDGIAKRSGVTTTQLLGWNNLRDPKALRAGMKLKVGETRQAVKADTGTTAVPVGELAGAPKRTPASLKDAAAVSKEATASPKATPAAAGAYRIQAGDTLGAIAAKHGVTTKQLLAWNNLTDPRSIKAGQTLILQGEALSMKAAKKEIVREGASSSLPKARAAATAEAASPAPVAPAAPEPQPEVPMASPPRAEGQGPPASPRQAEALTAPPSQAEVPTRPILPSAELGTPPAKPMKLAAAPKPVELQRGTISYQVKSGETLWDIARRHKVSIAQLQQWNHLADPSSVRPGTMLTIHQE
jgi:peptidoglycan lytic transglycosylase D